MTSKGKKKRVDAVLLGIIDASPKSPAPPDRQSSYLGRRFSEDNKGLQAQIDALTAKYGDSLAVKTIPTKDVHLSTSRFNRLMLTVQRGYPAFDELVESIKNTGGNQTPILVRTLKDVDGYELVYGERRWRACTVLSLPVKAIIADDLDDGIAIQLQQTENTARQSVSAIEHGWQVVSWASSLKHGETGGLADLLGIAVPHLSNLKLIGALPQSLADAHPDVTQVPFRAARRLAVLYRDEQALFEDRLATIAPMRPTISPGEATKRLLAASGTPKPNARERAASPRFAFTMGAVPKKDRENVIAAIRKALEPYGVTLDSLKAGRVKDD